jgi:hypothetical protein
LAGDNLSAAIAQALHYFVEKEEAKMSSKIISQKNFTKVSCGTIMGKMWKY